MAFKIAEAFVEIRPDLTKFGSLLKSGIKESQFAALGKIGDAFENVGKKLITRFAIPLGIAITANIAQFQGLDAQIRETLTLLDTPADRVTKPFQQMLSGITKVSENLGVLETNISEGVYQAISADIPPDNVFDFIDVAQRAAIAGGIDLVTSVDGITTAVNAFAAQGLSAERAADILFTGVAKGKTTFDQLAISMAKVAPAVAASGASFGEMIALASQMTKLGTPTAEAFTNIRAAMTGLLKPGDEVVKIFTEAGFASAQAAIQAIGLQGAMQLVADATGGSQTELIKLLGGFEAMNAVLQVTGANAESFQMILDATGESAGRMDTAFQTMQGGVGRAFGSLTAAFDRLGNASGQLAADFLVPLVRALTTAVTMFAQWVRRIRTVLQPIIKVWQKIVDTIFDNTVVAAFISMVGLMAGAFAIAATAAGVLLLSLGGLIGIWLQFRTLRTVTMIFTRGLIPAMQSGGILARLFGRKLQELFPKMTTFGKLGGNMGTSVTKLGAAMSASKGLLIGWGLAIAAVAVAVKIGRDLNEKWAESAKTMTAGADKLAESLGLVVGKIGEINIDSLDAADLTANIRFRVENIDLIRDVESTISRLGLQAGRDQIFTLVSRWISQGIPPDVAIEKAKEAIVRGGIPLDPGFLDNFVENSERAFLSVKQKARDLNKEFVAIGDSLFGFGEIRVGNFLNLFDKQVSKAEAGVAQLAQQVTEMFGLEITTGAGLAEFQDQVNELLGILGGPGSEEANIFLDEIAKSFEQVSDTTIDLNTDSIVDTISLMGDLGRVGVFNAEIMEGWRRGVQDGAADIVSSIEEIAAAPWDISQLTEENQKAFLDLGKSMEDLVASADQSLTDLRTSISDNLLGQLPMLDTYAGALTQPFHKWEAAQQQFREDFQKWRDRSVEILGSLPQGVKDKLNALPISQKVWLANLSPQHLESAISELTKSFELVTKGAAVEYEDRLPAAIRAAEAKLQTEYDLLQTQAEESGAAVAEGFRIKFAGAATQWSNIVSTESDRMKQKFNDFWDIGSPSRVSGRIAENIAFGFEQGLERNLGKFELPKIMQPQVDPAAIAAAIPTATPVVPVGAAGAPTIINNIKKSWTFNNPTARDADDDALKGAVLDRLAIVAP